MTHRPIKWLILFVFALPLHAGAAGELVFSSSFEHSEECTRFNGSNDIIDVPTAHIRGALTLNGGAFPINQYIKGQISLRDRITGDIFPLSSTNFSTYHVHVVAGRYDVLYSFIQGDTGVPRNVGAVVMQDVALVKDRTLDINVTAYVISGRYLLNGRSFPASAYDHGDFFLDGQITGRVLVGDSNQKSFADVMVMEGQYDVRFQSVQSDLVPANEFGFVRELAVTADANSLIFEVQSVNLGGTLRQNGALWPVSEYADGNFYLETSDGDRVSLGNSHFNNYQKQVMTGNYDVYWELETLADTVPVNVRARVGSNVEVAGNTLNINVISYQVSGNFTLDGGAFPASIYQNGQVVIRDDIAGSDSVLAETKEGGFQQRIVKGVYDTVYQHLQGEQIPQNKNATIQQNIVVNSAADINVSVFSGNVNTSVYHNGQLFPASQNQQGNILLRDLPTADQVYLGKTSLQNLSARVVLGTYDVYYSHLNGDQVPQNQMGLIHKNLVVNAPPTITTQNQATQLEATSIIVAGDFLINGGPMPVSEYDDGLINLRWEEDSVLLGNTHNQSFQARVLMNPYWVHYGIESGGELVPVNGDARFVCARLDPPIQ